MRCVPREAKVPMQCGPVSVSAVSIDDAVGRHADRLGADLRHDLLQALAEIDEDSVTMKLPVGVEWTSAWLGSPPRFMPVG